MSIRKTLVVFRKELLDLFRDKRTIITSIVVPIVLYPLMMIGFNSLMMRQAIKLTEQQVIIYVTDNAEDFYSNQVILGLEDAGNIQLYRQTDHYEKLFHEKIIQAIVTIESVYTEDDYSYLDIIVTYNRVDENSELAYSNIVTALRDIEQQLVHERLKAINISAAILNVLEVTDDNIASESQTLGLILSKILPYFLILISISGSAVAAVDLIAGEKERGTLETILVSAAHRNELVIGKYMAVITISLITVVLNLASIFFSFRHIMSQAAAEATTIQIPLGNIFLIFILMFPMIIFFSSLLLSLSTYSRNMKEAFSYTQPIMIVAMLFSLISTLPALQNSFMFTLIPVINVSLVIRDILVGNFNLFFFLSTLISTLILVFLGIYISVKLFSNEAVLFRTSEEGSVFKGKKGKVQVLSPNFAILFFLLILMLFFYLGISWQASNLETGLMATLLLLVLLPTLIVIKIGKLNFKEVLRLNPTKPINGLIVILTAVPLYIIVTMISQIINIFFPIPIEHLEALQEMLFLENRSIWFLLFLIAVLPGVCEEIMFRGYFLKVFEKKGMIKGIIISGLLFGILHLDIYRLIPVTLLGFWMGYITIKTNSIIIPIIAHTANNGFVILLGMYGDRIPGIEFLVQDDTLAWWLSLPAVLIFTLLVIYFKEINSKVLIDNEKELPDD